MLEKPDEADQEKTLSTFFEVFIKKAEGWLNETEQLTPMDDTENDLHSATHETGGTIVTLIFRMEEMKKNISQISPNHFFDQINNMLAIILSNLEYCIKEEPLSSKGSLLSLQEKFKMMSAYAEEIKEAFKGKVTWEEVTEKLLRV